MSSEIIKGLKIDTKNSKVFIKSCSTNVTPKYYIWQESLKILLGRIISRR